MCANRCSFSDSGSSHKTTQHFQRVHQDLASQMTFDNPESSTCANRWSFSDSGSSLCLVAAMASGWVRPQNNTAPLTMSRQVITGAQNYPTLPARVSRSGFSNDLRQPRKQHERQPLELLRLWLFSLCLVAAMASGWVRPQNNTAPLTMSRQVITGALPTASHTSSTFVKMPSQKNFDKPESSLCANRWSFSDSGSSLCLVAAMASGWVRPQNNTAPLTMSRQVITGAHNYTTGFSNDLRQLRKQHERQPLELLRLWLFSLSCGSYGFWVG